MLQRYFNGKKTFFSKEKKAWTKFFLDELTRCLNDEDAMALAVNDRESIDKVVDGAKVKYKHFTAPELQLALAAIDNQDEATYSLHDATRFGVTLGSAGFSSEELAAMKKSTILKYEAALFYASSNLNQLNLDAKYFALQDQYEVPEDKLEVMDDLREFRQGLITKILKPQILQFEYAAAKARLQKTIAKNSNIDPLLKAYGENVLATVEDLKSSSIPIEELTATLNIANNTIVNPTDRNTRACMQQGLKITAKYSAGRILGGLMLGLAGVAILVASVGVAAVSFGVLSPVTVAGFYFGASLIMGGAAIGAGIAGAGMVLGGGRLFSKSIIKNPLKKVMGNLAAEAGKHRVEEEPVIEMQQPQVEQQQQQQQQREDQVLEDHSDDDIDDEALADSAFGMGYRGRRG